MKSIITLLIAILFLVPGILPQAQIICVDPGHGGDDPGAVGNGLEEAAINLNVASRFATALNNAGYQARLTRSSDSTVSLSSRTSYANSIGAQKFISIHCNAFNASAHGTETYCYPEGSSTSFNMRDATNPQVVSALNTYNRGCKTANYYVLKYTNMPAILCELAFIDNANDAAKLGDAYYRQRAADALLRGLQQSREGERGTSNQPTLYMSPRLSPDGSQILVSGAGCQGIYLVPVNGGRPRLLSNQEGYYARWLSNSEIGYMALEAGVFTPFTVTTDGVQSRGNARNNEISVAARDGEIWVTRGSQTRQITNGGDIFYNPILSPNRQWVVYEGMASGLHVCDLDGANHLALGPGNNPSWLPSSRQILFDVAQDNGHEIVASDIWMVSLTNPSQRFNLSQGSGLMAQRPSVTADGLTVAFDAQGKIFTARIAQNSLKNWQEVSLGN